ncbi:hypothetical protein A6V39_00085 [Candidatus Mycoplasma haematobovis]|uniref:Uncharacterized protein n=1 Tax=Candidatus Mycoplasma haematobovis TaxID=432608 RepID=A0A1A9QD92_9MOLU|nr:hypothetical protein [Candidatus Mycoplasma haematobovis]OAL10447.1 hypothetical protein A6V39_00085 [Candidatus Mycoplasma haematobovis]
MASVSQILLLGGGITTISCGEGAGFYLYSIPNNVGQLLTKNGKILLNIKDKKHDGQWKKLAEKHKGNTDPVQIKAGVTINKIQNLQIAEPQSNKEINFSPLKTKCKELFETKISKRTTFDTVVKNEENWCTLESPILQNK